MIAIVAMGQQLVILTRGIDLSVGANVALASVVGGLVFRQVNSAPLVIAAMLACGAAVGAVNGVAYVFGRLPHPFIITLATLSICRGLALELAVGHTTMRGMPDVVTLIGGNFDLRLSQFLLRRRRGRRHRARSDQGDGLGPLAFRRRRRTGGGAGNGHSGERRARPTYVISGLFAGVGAVVLAGRTAASSPLYGNLLELDTIAAVIIGGASFLGGRGHLGHALIGAVMIGVIRNALNLLSVDVFFQMIAIGLIIVVAVEADVLRNRLEARARTLQAARTQSVRPLFRSLPFAMRRSASARCTRSETSAWKPTAARCWRCWATMARASRRW